MKNFGLVLVVVGFLRGAYLAASQVEGVPVTQVIVALIIAAAGVAITRYAAHKSARSEQTLATNIRKIEESLGRVVEEADRLEAEKSSINVYDLHDRIDQRFSEELHRFVEARESLAHSFGLQAYADVMNHFAAGERYLNRVWSASTDGYQEEAHTFIAKARNELTAALERFRAVRG